MCLWGTRVEKSRILDFREEKTSLVVSSSRWATGWFPGSQAQFWNHDTASGLHFLGLTEMRMGADRQDHLATCVRQKPAPCLSVEPAKSEGPARYIRTTASQRSRATGPKSQSGLVATRCTYSHCAMCDLREQQGVVLTTVTGMAGQACSC